MKESSVSPPDKPVACDLGPFVPGVCSVPCDDACPDKEILSGVVAGRLLLVPPLTVLQEGEVEPVQVPRGPRDFKVVWVIKVQSSPRGR